MIGVITIGDGDVWLEPFGDQHLTERYVGWLNDPEVVRYSEQRHRYHTLESCRTYRQGLFGTPHESWAIMTKRFGHVGNITATIDAANSVADLAILIGERSAWDNGIGTRAWTHALEWLLGSRGMRKVTAGAMAENKAMLAIMKKSGMKEEGRRHAQFLLDGRPVDVVLTARFADGLV